MIRLVSVSPLKEARMETNKDFNRILEMNTEAERRQHHGGDTQESTRRCAHC